MRKQVYLVLNSRFNNINHESLVGQYFEIAPSYMEVLVLEIDGKLGTKLQDGKILWKNIQDFRENSGK